MQTNHPSAVVAGGEAVLVREAAAQLHDLGGKTLLTKDAQNALRTGVQDTAARSLVTASVQSTTRAMGSAAIHCGRAAGLGGLLDGGVAAIDAGLAYRQGSVTREVALNHVKIETATGAAAAGIGAATATALVVLTGGMAAPAAFVVGAGVSAAAKSSLNSWWRS